MATGASLVSHSKVMAHMLPDVVPPIDGQHTLSYLSVRVYNGLEYERQVLRDVIQHFCIPVATNPRFRRCARRWMADVGRFPWDTSLFKTIDNLVIGAMRLPFSKEEDASHR